VGLRSRELATARRVLVTGATGFLGRHLIPLLTARGDAVVALVRPSADAAWLEEHGVRVVRGELLAGDALGAATGVELVFHVAGRVSHEPRELSRLREINVGGLGRVLEAAPGGARIVHVSSVAAVGPAPGPDQAATEAQLFPEWALRYPYAATKREGEAVAFAAAEAGRDVVIACPGFLLGPGDVYGISTWPVRRYLDGTLRIHEPGGLSHVDARDVAAGLLVLAERGRAGERTILTTRDGNLSHEDLFRKVGEITGVRRRMVGLHPRVAALGARLVRWPVKPGEVRAAAHWWFYDPAKAERELGWTPRPIDKTILDTAADYL
jgi:dihydroflavonol-4-reductase